MKGKGARKGFAGGLAEGLAEPAVVAYLLSKQNLYLICICNSAAPFFDIAEHAA